VAPSKANDFGVSTPRWLALTALYFGGLAVLLLNLSPDITDFGRSLSDHLWEPVAFMLMWPFVGFLYLFVPIVGTIGFACWGKRFQRHRLFICCALLATLYLIGNEIGFHRYQWYDLHAYMCGALLTVGARVPLTKFPSCLAFGLLVIAYGGHVHVGWWRLFDYVWGVYFLLLSVLVYRLPISDPTA
jgi:hypothetical protein